MNLRKRKSLKGLVAVILVIAMMLSVIMPVMASNAYVGLDNVSVDYQIAEYEEINIPGFEETENGEYLGYGYGNYEVVREEDENGEYADYEYGNYEVIREEDENDEYVGYDYSLYEEVEEVIIEIAPFSVNLTPHVTVTAWDLRNASGLSIFGDPADRFEIRNASSPVFSFSFDWTLTAPSGTVVQEGDRFSFARPTIATQGSFGFLNQATQPITDNDNVVIGEWYIQSNTIHVVFNENAAGSSTISGSIQTGVSINASINLGGVRNVTFAGQSREATFIQQTLSVSTSNQNKSVANQSSSQVTWRIDTHTIGLRELSGQLGRDPLVSPGPDAWGEHFTPTRIFFEDTLAGSFISIIFSVRIGFPASLEPGSASHGFNSGATAWTVGIGARVTRVYPDADESRADFRDRLSLTPFQWGVWEDPITGAETVMAYFGTLGVDGPQLSELDIHFAEVAANNAINNGYYDESYRAALEAYFTKAFGDGNAIEGRIPSVRMNITEGFNPVTGPTPTSNTMTVYRDGVPEFSTATATLQPSGALATAVPANSARLILSDEITNTALAGATFQLQVQGAGNTWTNVTTPGVGVNGVFTTNSDGFFDTPVLGNGTYRFVQLTAPTTPAGDWRAAPSGAAEVTTVVSDEFTLTGGAAEGETVEVRNIRRFTVSFNAHGGGGAFPNQQIVHNQLATQPATDPTSIGTRVGYTFAGWFTTATGNTEFDFTAPVTSDREAHAQWLRFEVSYQFTGDIPTGTGAPTAPETRPVTAGTLNVSPTTAATTFTGVNSDGVHGTWTRAEWATTSTGANPTSFTMPNNNVHFTGNWTFAASGFEVSYQFTGDVPTGTGAPTAPTTRPVTAGTTNVSPTTAATTFTGVNSDGVHGTWTRAEWATTSTGANPTSFTMPNNNVHFTANWTFAAREHTVTFLPGAPSGVDGMPNNRTVRYNNTIYNAQAPNNGAVNVPTRPGYIFVGWLPSVGGGPQPISAPIYSQIVPSSGSGIILAAYIADVVITSNMTYTAVWRAAGAPLFTKTSPTVGPVNVGDTIAYVITLTNKELTSIPGEFVITDVIDERVEFLLNTVAVYRNGSPLTVPYVTYGFADSTRTLTVTLNGIPAATAADNVTEIRFSVEVLPTAAGSTIENAAVLQQPPGRPPVEPPPPVITEINPHTVTFLYGAATNAVTNMPNNKEVPDGDTIVSVGMVTNPLAMGYIFIGWEQTTPEPYAAGILTSADVKEIEVTQDKEFTAQWQVVRGGGGSRPGPGGGNGDDTPPGTEITKIPDRVTVNAGETINWTLRGFQNPTGNAVRNFAVVDVPSVGLNFQSGRIPAFHNGAGITYDIRYRVVGSNEWRTHQTGIDASRPFNFTLSETGDVHYTAIGLFFGDVPANFGRGNEMVFTFKVTDEARGNTLVNELLIRYDDVELEGYGYVNLGVLFSSMHEAYLVGFPDGTVRPNQSITRAEVATIFFRLLDDDYRAQIWSQQNSFSDVTASNWFNNAVSTLTTADILEGFPDGTFRGNQAITRAEFVTIVARFIEEPAHAGTDLFNDISDHWAREYINSVGHYDWIRGFAGGDFRPNQSITRAEAAAIINRMLNRLPETSADLLPGMVTWSDNMNQNAWFYLYIQEATNSHDFEMKADGIHERWTELREPRDWTVLERPNSRPQDIR